MSARKAKRELRALMPACAPVAARKLPVITFLVTALTSSNRKEIHVD
jgi:hypothetical protein